MCHPPVGGQLKYFASNWRKITGDPWLLNIVSHGYCIEFSQLPHACPDWPLRSKFSLAEKHQINVEVGNHLQKGLFINVPTIRLSFCLTYFWS